MNTSTRTAVRPPQAGRRLRGRPWPTVVIVGIGVMMADLDMTIVAVANPVIKQALHASFADIQWITSAYLLALASALITGGKVADRIGYRRAFLIGVTGFAMASAAIGLADRVEVIIAFRAVQGMSAALLMPAALGALRAAFPPEKLSLAVGGYGMITGAAAAAGPVVGGLLVERFGWQAAFFINVPIGALAIVWGLITLRASDAAGQTGPLDIPGMALLSTGMLCLIWTLINVEAWGWINSRTWLLLITAGAAFAAFAAVDSRARDPLLHLFRSASLTAGVILVILTAFALVGGLFFITFFLQNVAGMSPIDAAVRLLPLTAVTIVAAPAAGALISRIGPRIPMACGMVLAAAGLFGMSTLSSEAPTIATSGWLALLSVGVTPVIVGTTDVIVGNAPPRLSGVAAGLQQSAMQIGGSLGTAILGTIMAARVGVSLPQRWSQAGLPPLPAQEMARAEDLVSAGSAPELPNAGPALVERIVAITHDIYLSGMAAAFRAASAVAMAAVAVAVVITGRVRTNADEHSQPHS